MKLWKSLRRSRDVLRCSFCNKAQRDVRKLIAGPSVYICDECVDICLDIIFEDLAEARDAALRRQARDKPPACVICNNEVQAEGRIELGVWGWTCQRCAEGVRDALLWWSDKDGGGTARRPSDR